MAELTGPFESSALAVFLSNRLVVCLQSSMDPNVMEIQTIVIYRNDDVASLNDDSNHLNTLNLLIAKAVSAEYGHAYRVFRLLDRAVP